jgi:uncharacterized protein YkwD
MIRLRISFYTGLALLFLISPATSHAAPSLTQRLSGRILLQVQSHGEAWYVDPITKTRFYLGTPEAAFQVLRARALGIKHADLLRLMEPERFPMRLYGRMLLDVDDHGQAYYVEPGSMRAIPLGSADETYGILRLHGLGITNVDLQKIPVAPSVIITPVASTPQPTPTPISAPSNQLERQTFDEINQHRQSIGLQALIWNETVAETARIHSQNMANDTVPFSHDGFDARFERLNTTIRISNMAENVAFNNFDTPVETAVTGWLQSQGHKQNIEAPVYTETGIGVVKGQDNAYYFTQIFIKPRRP